MSETIEVQTTGQCRLCGASVPLEGSHILPKFVYQWLKKSSATDHIRSAAQINVPKQDGLKVRFLGRCCEDRFSRLETQFVGNFFTPYNASADEKFSYAAWMSGFCVSVAWRVLAYRMEQPEAKNKLSPDVLRNIDLALECWRSFLLGRVSSTHPFDVYLFPLQTVVGFVGADGPPPDLNRFLLRAIDMGLVRDSRSAHAYCKMGRLVLLGAVLDPDPRELESARIDLTSGVFNPNVIAMPTWLMEYLVARSVQLTAVEDRMSERQKGKIAEKQSQNPARVKSSQTYRAMQDDIALRRPSGEEGAPSV